MNIQELIENIVGISRKEMQSIEFKSSKAGLAYWTIKMYALLTEDVNLIKKVFDIDRRLQQRFYQLSYIPQDIILSTCNQVTSPVLSFELSRGAKGEYSFAFKYRSEHGKENEMVERVKELNDIVNSQLK